jgi:hypothetical protein
MLALLYVGIMLVFVTEPRTIRPDLPEVHSVTSRFMAGVITLVFCGGQNLLLQDGGDQSSTLLKVGEKIKLIFNCS